MLKVVFLSIFLFSILSGFAQSPKIFSDSLEVWENIHLHINKTTFLQGERLWFKAYVQDQKTEKLSYSTTDLHVALYDKTGQEIKRKLIYVENGLGQGDFAIDSTLTKTEYTLLAWTNYMRNFKELAPFRQNITVLKEDFVSDNDLDSDLSITAFPEGGNLMEDAYNHIGILVKDNSGHGVSVNNISLVDEKGKIIQSNIATNAFGMGKTGLIVEKSKRYFLKLQRPGAEGLTAALPAAIKNQMGLNIDNTGQDQVLLKLVASKATFDTKDGENYSMAFYRDEFIHFENIEISPDEPIISMRREQLPYGILTTVLFDQELKPIAYRMFFNHGQNETRLMDLEIDHCLTAFGDSIQVDLILPKDIQSEANLSMSTLPSESLALAPDNSIITSFLVRPYIKNYFGDHYFFEKQSRKKRFELDNRLLIEGWGRYDWDSKKLQKAKKEFEMESGISFEGKVLDADLNEENQVYFVADLSSAMQFEELQKDKSFTGNMVLFEGDSLGITVIGKKGKLRKPKVEVQLFENLESIDDTKNWLSWEVLRSHKNERKEEILDEPINIGERTIVLEEVTVTESALKLKRTPMFVPRGTLLPITEGIIIGDAEIKRYNSVSSFLSLLGYSRSMGLDADGFPFEMLLSPKSNVPVSVDIGLLNVPLSRVQAIYYDANKEVYVNIILRSNHYERPEDRNKFVKFAIENGYAQPQEYFTPNYPDYSTSVFKNYGALDWKANILVDSELPTSINIPVKNQNGIQLYIEGMSSNGSLISTSREISFKVLESEK